MSKVRLLQAAHNRLPEGELLTVYVKSSLDNSPLQAWFCSSFIHSVQYYKIFVFHDYACLFWCPSDHATCYYAILKYWTYLINFHLVLVVCREALLRHPTCMLLQHSLQYCHWKYNCVILMEGQNLILKFCMLPPEYSWHAGCFLHLLMVNYSYSCTLWMEHWALLWGLAVQIQVMLIDKPYYLWINDQWTTVVNLFSGEIWGNLKFL